MRICTSSIDMCSSSTSSYSYGHTISTASKNLTSGTLSYAETSTNVSFSDCIIEKKSNGALTKPLTKDNGPSENDVPKNFSNYFDSGTKKLNNNQIQLEGPKQLQEKSEQYFINQLRKFILALHERISSRFKLFNPTYGNGILDISSGSNVSIIHKVSASSYTYEEAHSFSFETTGSVITEDGRSLEFNLNINMTSLFEYCSDIQYESIDAIYTDPLVINLDTNPIGISDQFWDFDIDADGNIDTIPLLKPGSGFLVFDKNEDGIINNGLEMFGTKSGNGFADLAIYDLDNNGWIDENDDIFSKLSIWTKNTNGEDRLLSLKEAGIGAIYLDALRSNYKYNSSDNDTKALLKSAGFFLYESGVSNSIMQLDFVSKA